MSEFVKVSECVVRRKVLKLDEEVRKDLAHRDHEFLHEFVHLPWWIVKWMSRHANSDWLTTHFYAHWPFPANSNVERIIQEPLCVCAEVETNGYSGLRSNPGSSNIKVSAIIDEMLGCTLEVMTRTISQC